LEYLATDISLLSCVYNKDLLERQSDYNIPNVNKTKTPKKKVIDERFIDRKGCVAKNNVGRIFPQIHRPVLSKTVGSLEVGK
jgi:hypothetical protein